MATRGTHDSIERAKSLSPSIAGFTVPGTSSFKSQPSASTYGIRSRAICDDTRYHSSSGTRTISGITPAAIMTGNLSRKPAQSIGWKLITIWSPYFSLKASICRRRMASRSPFTYSRCSMTTGWAVAGRAGASTATTTSETTSPRGILFIARLLSRKPQVRTGITLRRGYCPGRTRTIRLQRRRPGS